MRLSARTEYAAIAVVELARHVGSRNPVRIRAICEAQGVPAGFLVHILLQLKAAGIITSTRGAAGGYRLARPPQQVTLEDIHRAVEEPGEAVSPISVQLASQSPPAAVLVGAWREVAAAEAKALRSVSIAELASRCKSAHGAMYHI